MAPIATTLDFLNADVHPLCWGLTRLFTMAKTPSFPTAPTSGRSGGSGGPLFSWSRLFFPSETSEATTTTTTMSSSLSSSLDFLPFSGDFVLLALLLFGLSFSWSIFYAAFHFVIHKGWRRLGVPANSWPFSSFAGFFSLTGAYFGAHFAFRHFCLRLFHLLIAVDMVDAFLPAAGLAGAEGRNQIISSFINYFKTGGHESNTWNKLSAHWLSAPAITNPRSSVRPSISICERSSILFHFLDFRSSGGIFAHFCHLNFIFRFPFCLPSIFNAALAGRSTLAAKLSRTKTSSSSSSSLSFSSPRTRYRVFLPSDATEIGAFAGDCLPAGAGYATPAQKRRIREIGAASGCHTCGRRKIPPSAATAADKTTSSTALTTTTTTDEAVDFYADHQPPLSRNHQTTKVSLSERRKVKKGSAFGGIFAFAFTSSPRAKLTGKTSPRVDPVTLTPRFARSPSSSSSSTPVAIPRPHFSFYPQCVRCSRLQSAALAHPGLAHLQREALVAHGFWLEHALGSFKGVFCLNVYLVCVFWTVVAASGLEVDSWLTF